MNLWKRFWAFANRPLFEILKKKTKKETVATLGAVPTLEEFIQKAQRLVAGPRVKKTYVDVDGGFDYDRHVVTYHEKYSACETCKGRWYVPHIIASDLFKENITASITAICGLFFAFLGAIVFIAGCILQDVTTISVSGPLTIVSIFVGNIGLSVNKRLDHKNLKALNSSMKKIAFDDALKQVFERESWADQHRLIGNRSELQARFSKLQVLSVFHGESIAFLELRVSEERVKSGEDGVPSYLREALEKTKQEHEAAKQGREKIVKIMDSLKVYFEREREKALELFQPLRDLEKLKEIEARGIEIGEAIEQANQAATNAIIDVHERRKAFAAAIQSVCELRLIEKGSEVATNLDYYDATMEELVRLGAPRLKDEDPVVEPVT